MDAINDIHHQSGWLSHHSHHESHRDTSWPLAVIWVIGSLRLMDDRDDHLESSGALVKRNLRKHSKLTRLFSSKQWLSSNIHLVHFMILMTSFSESSRRQATFELMTSRSFYLVDVQLAKNDTWPFYINECFLPLLSVCWWEICMQYQHHQNGSIPLLSAPHWWMWWCSHGKTNSLTCMNYREEPSWI